MRCFKCCCDLQRIDFRGIAVNECPKCHGRWFDRKELRKAKDNTDEDLRWLDFDPFNQKAGHFNMVTDIGNQCPQCAQRMTSRSYKNSGVVIDTCTQCEGVWLQGDEFRRIITYLEDLIASESVGAYVMDSLKKFLEIVTGPEGRMTEVKDFLVILKLLKLRAAVEHSKLAEATNKIYQYLPFL